MIYKNKVGVSGLDLNVLGFNQKKVIKIKNIKIEKRKNAEKEIIQTLEIEDLYLLNRLFNFRGSAKTANAIIDGKVFFWINYKTLLENMPILNMTKETLMNKFKKYVDMKLIERKQIYEKDGIKGTYSYMHITEKLEDLQINKNDVMDSGCDDDVTEGVTSTRQGVSRQHDRGCDDDMTAKKGIQIKGKDINSSSKEKPNDYRRHSQNENIQTKEVEQAWKECGLAEYKYTPVENINIAIKIFGLAEVIKAIQRISRSSLMKTKTNIDSFFNKNNDFEEIGKTHNATFDDSEKKGNADSFSELFGDESKIIW